MGDMESASDLHRHILNERTRETAADPEAYDSRFAARLAAQQSSDLRPHAVRWDDITRADGEELAHVLQHATDERPLQALLQERPRLLVQHLQGGHGRWLVPQPRFGSQHVPDFLIADAFSFGLQWVAVELESPTARMFNQSGDPSAALTHAIRQIHDWRSWLTRNIDYATRARANGGLGFPDLDGNVEGLIVIGRRPDEDEDSNRARRRQMINELRIAIHSYDWLLDTAMTCAARHSSGSGSTSGSTGSSGQAPQPPPGGQ